jgi:hypothetical protein
VALGGCARGTAEGTNPTSLMDVIVTYVGSINENFFYYIPIDADNELADGPIPVAAGPYWGNGWGTGSMTHYVQYHSGFYRLYRVLLTPELRIAGGGITAVDPLSAPVVTKTGIATVTVGALLPGAATVAGAGMVTALTNVSDQNAGSLTVATNASGNIVAGSIVFTPNPSGGGHSLTGSEQSQVNALNGQPLTASSFSFLGLTLTLGPAAAGTQTITVAAATANASAHFVGDSPPQITTDTVGTLTANSAGSATNTLLPGVLIATADLVPGGQASIALIIAREGALIRNAPYDFTPPRGGNSLRFSLDLGALAPRSDFLSINFISVTKLIFDPATPREYHVYDAQGPLGNDYVTIHVNQFATYKNGDGLVTEGANDATLQGRATETEKGQVDLIDWTVIVRRL